MPEATPLSVADWLERMRRIWLEKRPNDMAHLLSHETLHYYENPFEPPLTSVAEVVEAWQEIKGQEIEAVEMTLLHETPERIGMAMWSFKQKNQPLHVGSYYIELDEKGLCKHFRQWWTV